jgi:hypothetical protein
MAAQVRRRCNFWRLSPNLSDTQVCAESERDCSRCFVRCTIRFGIVSMVVAHLGGAIGTLNEKKCTLRLKVSSTFDFLSAIL